MKRSETWLVFGLCAAIGWFYVWTVRSNGESWRFGEEQRDYYNLLIDGYLDGHLHMKVEVPEALLKLADPYDPAQRPPGLGLHDASFYRGKYYVYFGVAPAVTLMLPFRVVTGTDLPLPAAILVFTYGGFLVSAGLWLALRRRYFPDARIGLSLACIAVLGTASMGPLLLRRPSIWELPLSGGYFFGLVALACVYGSLHAVRRDRWWLTAASVSLGLAVASRPTYLFAIPLLAVPVLWPRRKEVAMQGRMRLALSRAVAAFLPLVMIGVGLAIYNFVRFDDPLEFGVRYQFSGIYESKARHFSWDYLAYNLRLYFLQPAEWSWFFPFLHAARPPAFPAGYFGFEFVFGLLVSAPVLWLALAATFVVRNNEDERERLRPFLIAAAVMAAGMVLVAGFFYAAMGRYQVDFSPTLMLLACVGVLGVERALGGAMRSVQIAAKALLGGLLAMSIGFGMLASIELYGNLRRLNPRAYARLAAIGNQPGYWLERLAGRAHGPVEFALRLPADMRAGREVLVSTGAFGASDTVFIAYQDDGNVRLGFLHEGGHETMSRPLTFDRSREQHVRIEMGSLLPPETHPFFRHVPESVSRRITRHLCVAVEGDVVLESYQRFHPAVSRWPSVGTAEAAGNANLRPFSGEVLRVARDTDIARMTAAQTERIIMRVQFAGPPTTQWEPLFTIEGGDRGVCRLVAPNEVQLGYAPATGAVQAFAVMKVDPERIHDVEWIATTWPDAPEAGRAAATQLIAKIGGVVLGTWTGGRPVSLRDWASGNGGTSHPEVAPAFAGIVHGAEHLSGERATEFSAVRVRLMFPAGKVGEREPLLVTGEPGRGDQVFVEYLDAQRVRFGFEHWGKPPLWSAPVDVARDQPQLVEIALASFPQSKADSDTGEKPVRVSLNGRPVWAWETKLFPVEARDVFVARNPIGGTACGPSFSGSVLAVEFVDGNDL